MTAEDLGKCGNCEYFDRESFGRSFGTNPEGEVIGRCRVGLGVPGTRPGLLLGDLLESGVCKQPLGVFKPRSARATS